jgi:hypothetical protein
VLYLVHGAVVLHVGEEDGHVDNVGKRGTLGLENYIDANRKRRKGGGGDKVKVSVSIGRLRIPWG